MLGKFHYGFYYKTRSIVSAVLWNTVRKLFCQVKELCLRKTNLHYSSHLIVAGAIYSCSSVTVFMFLLGRSFCTPALSPVGQESASWHCSCGTLGVGLKRPSVSSLDSNVTDAFVRVCVCEHRVHVLYHFLMLFRNYVQKWMLRFSAIVFFMDENINVQIIFQNYDIFEIHSCERTNCILETMCNYMNSP